jgi:clan AA aspartic protease
MGSVRIPVTLINVRDEVAVRLGQLTAGEVRRYTTEALIDTGATRSTLPPFVADQLGLLRLGRTEAQMAGGRRVEVDVAEPVLIDVLGRQTSEDALVLGEQALLGVTVLEKLDLVADCVRGELLPNVGTRDHGVPGVGLTAR